MVVAEETPSGRVYCMGGYLDGGYLENVEVVEGQEIDIPIKGLFYEVDEWTDQILRWLPWKKGKGADRIVKYKLVEGVLIFIGKVKIGGN